DKGLGGIALETVKNRLASAYRRRAACATLGVALMAAGIASPTLRLWAQGTAPESSQKSDAGKTPQQPPKDKNGTIRIIPMPRKDQPGRAAAPGSAPPLPGGTPPAPGTANP